MSKPIPTFLPRASIGYQRQTYACAACDLLVSGAYYDGANQLCARCSMALGCTLRRDWPDDVRLKVLTDKRRAVVSSATLGLWARFRRWLRGIV